MLKVFITLNIEHLLTVNFVHFFLFILYIINFGNSFIFYVVS